MRSNYFREAQRSVNQRFSSFTGEELNGLQFSGGNYASFASDYNAAGPQAGAVKDSKPYEVEVVNANLAATVCFLWGSNLARTSVTFNNPAGITVTSATPNVSYLEMLADSESGNFEVGKTYIEVVAGASPTAALTATWSLTYKNSDGKLVTDPIPVKINPMQQITTVLEFYYTFPLDGYTNIQITIPASTTIRYSFYVSATNRPGRHLLNQNTVKEFADTPIVRPTPIALTPRALAALSGKR